jgi:hypothetical protein
METSGTDTPAWDVALEALLRETSLAEGGPLTLQRLQTLAGENTIRLDDMLDTLCQLVAHERWTYQPPAGSAGPPDPDMCKLLRANHRLNDTQLGRLGGRWQPRDRAAR